jgi:hypothetical protein
MRTQRWDLGGWCMQIVSALAPTVGLFVDAAALELWRWSTAKKCQLFEAFMSFDVALK